MAIATQASLFTPTLSAAKPADCVAAQWKQSITQFSTPKPIKSVASVSHCPIRAMAEDEPAATKEPEAPAGFTPPELPKHPSSIFGGSTGGLLLSGAGDEAEIQVHPKDGVYPEKVNPLRTGVGQNMRSIGKNVSPIEVKFTGKQVYDL
ncbi:UNVERIFIED_CONTAM: Photosystem I reaction center subunit II, chloroplastic [Sesamum angustifolium]|uniref:Photosystem I reaction center subunit II, chloroplastic n=1 Tax=Sesamum angustifolium TaxID=2727405 RepID=A0AAW2LZQ1_9LAMI